MPRNLNKNQSFIVHAVNAGEVAGDTDQQDLSVNRQGRRETTGPAEIQ